MKKEILILLYLVGFFVSCEDSTESTIQSQLVREGYEFIVPDTIYINQGNFIEIKGYGIEPTDEIFLRSVDNTSSEIRLHWGYKRLATTDYAKDSVLMSLPENDKWHIGDWEVIVKRQNLEQNLGKLHFAILTNIKLENKAYANMIIMQMNGWDHVVDNFYLKDANSEKEIKIETVVSSGENVTLQFPEIVTDGEWNLIVKRWHYGLSQLIFRFNYTKVKFANDEPIRKDKEGNYVIALTWDRVMTGDVVSLKPPTGKVISIKIQEKDFSVAEKILKVIIPSEKIIAGEWQILVKREGQYTVFNNKKILIIE